LINQSLI